MKEKFSIGIDVGGTKIKFGIINSDGKISKKIVLPTDSKKGPEAVISQIEFGIKSLKKNFKREILGIGIGIPGSVMLKQGTVENPPNFPGWSKVPLGKILSERLGIGVNIENDANIAAVGELIYGAGKKLDDFLMVTLGTGVGGGIIINKKLYRGSHGSAGEIGHVSINSRGKKCKCGSRGCIETYVGNNYLISSVKKDLPNHRDSLLFEFVDSGKHILTPKLISRAAIENDDYSISIIKQVGQALGYGITSVINVLDISNVIIGGGVGGFGKILFNSIEEAIKSRVMIPLKNKVKIYPAKLKNNAGIKGASALVFYKS